MRRNRRASIAFPTWELTSSMSARIVCAYGEPAAARLPQSRRDPRVETGGAYVPILTKPRSTEFAHCLS
jgi:hypothetical protein